MRPPYENERFGRVEAPHSEKISKASLETLAETRKAVLAAVLDLKKQSEKTKINLNDIHDERVKHVSDVFEKWLKEINDAAPGEENTEARLILLLEQEMLIFDADWVNEKPALEEINESLDEKLTYATEAGFTFLKKKIEVYKAAVEAKMV